MITEQLYVRRQQKNYYCENLRRIVKFVYYSCFVILLLIGAILYEFFTNPEPYYYATSNNGQLTQLLAVPKGTGLIIPSNTQ